MSLGRFEISGGALLVLALLYYLDSSGIFPWVLLACAFHELGHWWAVAAMGGQVRRLSLSCAGAELRLSTVRPLPPAKMVLAALAGPGVNLLLALGSTALAGRGAGERLYFFAGLNWGLAIFNLLPAAWLDGGRALENILAFIGERELGLQITELCSVVVAALLMCAGGILLWESGGRNFTLLVAGLWMTQAACQAHRGTF